MLGGYGACKPSRARRAASTSHSPSHSRRSRQQLRPRGGRSGGNPVSVADVAAAAVAPRARPCISHAAGNQQRDDFAPNTVPHNTRHRSRPHQAAPLPPPRAVPSTGQSSRARNLTVPQARPRQQQHHAHLHTGRIAAQWCAECPWNTQRKRGGHRRHARALQTSIADGTRRTSAHHHNKNDVPFTHRSSAGAAMLLRPPQQGPRAAASV